MRLLFFPLICLRIVKCLILHDTGSNMQNKLSLNSQNHYEQHMVMCTHHHQANKVSSIILILSTWPMELLDSNPFVTGSAIVISEPMC
jgi:hypothetical protein